MPLLGVGLVMGTLVTVAAGVLVGSASGVGFGTKLAAKHAARQIVMLAEARMLKKPVTL